MSQSIKLTRAQREQIIFDYLKGNENPLYEVSQTKYGKYIVKPKQIPIEEEEEVKEPEHKETKLKPKKAKSNNDESNDYDYDSYDYDDDDSSSDEEELLRHKHNTQILKKKRAKQDAKRILDALANLINNGDSSDDDGYERPRAPPIIEQPNLNPNPITFRRRRLAF